MRKKYKNEELRRKVSIGVGSVLLVIVIIMGILEVHNRAAQKAVNTLYDTTVIDYEAYASELSDLVTIYSIYNDRTYQNAKQSCNLSSELRDRIFATDSYMGSYTNKPYVTLREVQYELEPTADNVRRYYAVLEVQNNDNGKIRLYSIIATLKDDVLLDYYTI